MIVFILLFGVVAAWAALFRQIGDVDFANPNGGIILYDNDKYLDVVAQKLPNKRSAIIDTNLILVGPVTIKYDIKANAKKIAQTLDIQSFEIDFDNGDAK